MKEPTYHYAVTVLGAQYLVLDDKLKACRDSGERAKISAKMAELKDAYIVLEGLGNHSKPLAPEAQG